MRSKVKRQFRAKKREEGVYAATEAARLQRLNMKLRALTTTTPAQEKEKAEDEMPVEGEGEWQDEPGAGWYSSTSTDSESDTTPFFLSALGLFDSHDLTAEHLGDFCTLHVLGGSACVAGGRQGRSTGMSGLDHLFPGLPLLGSGSGNDG